MTRGLVPKKVQKWTDKNRDPEVLIFGVCPKIQLITFVQSLLEDVCRVLGSQKITFCCKLRRIQTAECGI